MDYHHSWGSFVHNQSCGLRQVLCLWWQFLHLGSPLTSVLLNALEKHLLLLDLFPALGG